MSIESLLLSQAESGAMPKASTQFKDNLPDRHLEGGWGANRFQPAARES
jgi:hypothetical protein